MITQQLIEYVRQRVSEGVAREDITKELLGVGWIASDLNKVFASSEVMTVNVSSQNMPQVQAQITTNSNEVTKDVQGNSVQKVSAEGISSVAPETASQQHPESFVPPTSIEPAHATHDSFWYRPVIIISVLVILASIAGGGVYAYYTYTKQPSAISVLGGVFKNMAQINSFNFAATSTSATVASAAPFSSMLGTKTTNTSFNLATASTSAVVTNATSSALSSETHTNVSSAKLYATTTIAEHGTIVMPGKDSTRPNFDILMALNGSLSVATTSGAYSVGLHAVLSPKAFDIKLLHGNVSVTSSNPRLRMGPAFVNAALAGVSNKWVRLIDFTNATSSQQFDKAFSKLSSPTITKDMKNLRAYASSLQYIRFARNVGIEYLNGVPTYHLSLVIQNTPAAVLMVQRLMYDYSQSLHIGGATQTMSFADFLQATKPLDTTLTQRIPIDIWVGKNDSRVYKLTISNLNFILSNSSSITSREVIRLTDYNTTPKIIAPKNPESIQSLIGSIFGSGFGGGL